MTFNLVLAQVFPSVKPLAAFFAGVLHASLDFRRPAFCDVVTDKPLCYPDQACVWLQAALYGYLRYSLSVAETTSLVEALQQSICLHLLSVGGNVAPDDICPIRLKIPRSNKNQIAVPYPHPSLYLSSDAAGPYLAVSTLYNYVVAPDQLDDAA